MRVDVGQPHLNFGYALRVRGVLGFSEQACPFRVGGKHPIEQARIAARCLLRDVAEAGISRNGNRPVVRRDLAFQKPQQRRLACAIAPDKPDLMARRNSRRRRFQDRFAFDAIGEIVDMKHGRCG